MKEKIQKWTKEKRILCLVLAAAIVLGIVAAVLLTSRGGWRSMGSRRYYRQDGSRVTGWCEVEGRRYYFDPATGGGVHTGWLEIDGETYYLDLDGSMRVGWLEKPDGRYYFDTDGKMHTGWLETGSGRYYMGPDGKMCTGWLEVDAKRCYLDENGHPVMGWTELDGARYYFDSDGMAHTGWLETTQGRCYLDAEGKLCSGWLELDGKTYFLDENGYVSTGWVDSDGKTYYMEADGGFLTGWQNIDGETYYFLPDGAMAKGQVQIEEKTYFFSSAGKQILLVNRWNPLPEDYSVNLVYSDGGGLVSEECADALYRMMADCKASGCYPYVCSSYRSVGVQISLFKRQIGIQWMYSSSYDEAYEKAAQIVAIPGTSEHHTGLAVDIVDGSYGLLDEKQAETASQQWLMENSWRYGFILRYPDDTTEWTGIVYEPWHYRYVGEALAKELFELDMCLEEYLAMLSE